MKGKLYLLKRVLQRMRERWILHLSVSLILALGAMILTLMLNQLFTSEAFIHEAKEDLMATPITLHAVNETPLALVKGPALSVEAFQRLDYPHLALHYKLYMSVRYIYQEDEAGKGSFLGFPCYVLNDEVAKAYGLDLQAGSIMLGAQAKERLEKLARLKPCGEDTGYPCYDHLTDVPKQSIVMDDRQLQFAGQSFAYRIIDERTGKRYLESLAGSQQSMLPTLSECLVMHLDDYARQPFLEKSSLSRLGVAYLSEEGPKEVYALMRDLYEQNPDYSYWQEDQLRQLRKYLYQTIQKRETEQWLAVISFILVLVGLWILYALRLKDRKKDAAISLAMGSSLKEQALELWLEVHLLLASGIGAGALAAAFIDGDFAYDYLPNRYHPETLAFLGLLIVLMGTLATFIPIREIRKMAPVAILRENH